MMELPIYIQIADTLLERISSGELAPEQRLPSERALSQTLNVSRMTLRAALRVLDNKGLLVRRPGDGTYIAKPKIERQAAKLVPFTESWHLYCQAKDRTAGGQVSAVHRKYEQPGLSSERQADCFRRVLS
jgi:DNA-binding GntR family transcriptional regulator